MIPVAPLAAAVAATLAAWHWQRSPSMATLRLGDVHGELFRTVQAHDAAVAHVADLRRQLAEAESAQHAAAAARQEVEAWAGSFLSRILPGDLAPVAHLEAPADRGAG